MRKMAMSAVAPLTAIGVDATWMSVGIRGVQSSEGR